MMGTIQMTKSEYAELADLQRETSDTVIFEQAMVALYAGDRNCPDTAMDDHEASRWAIGRALALVRVLREERHKVHG